MTVPQVLDGSAAFGGEGCNFGQSMLSREIVPLGDDFDVAIRPRPF